MTSVAIYLEATGAVLINKSTGVIIYVPLAYEKKSSKL